MLETEKGTCDDASKLICENCGKEVKEAYWLDGYKVRGEVGWIFQKVAWDQQSETFILDTMIEEIEKKYDWFDEEMHYVQLLSFGYKDFTLEDLEKINLGFEETGAVCENCKSSL